MSACATTSEVERIRMIHGGTGPFVVAGYRMGQKALQDLQTQAGDFKLQVVHASPPQVQWSCIADGVQAATGASLGKLNLRRIDAPQTTTTFQKGPRRVVLRLTPDFVARYWNTPRDALERQGSDVLALPDDAIFETVTSTTP